MIKLLSLIGTIGVSTTAVTPIVNLDIINKEEKNEQKGNVRLEIVILLTNLSFN